MKPKDWKKSRYEGVDEIARLYGYYASLAHKKCLTFQFRLRQAKDEAHFERIEKICAELDVPASIFFDVLFRIPFDLRKYQRGWRYPYLNYLSSDTAKFVFTGRVNEYRKRLGVYDKVLDYIREMSVANLDVWFGESFYQGFWVLHRALDRKEEFSIREMFEIFSEDPVFAPIFIVTHGAWRRFAIKNVQDSLVKELKGRCKGELSLMSDRYIARRFMEVRGRKRRDAQFSWAKRRDEKWEKIWKILS